jgi:hypothetical protein
LRLPQVPPEYEAISATMPKISSSHSQNPTTPPGYMSKYIKTVHGMNNQARNVSNKLLKALLTYTGEISHHTRIASRGPTKIRAVSIQHMLFSFF